VRYLRRNYGWIVVVVLAIAPLFILLSMINVDFASGSLVTLRDGVDGEDPLAMLYHISGEFAIRWMTAVLTCTPFFIVFGVNNLFVRQSMGIATASWSFLHFLIFIWAEGFWETFTQLNYVAGFLAVLILIPLFFTSNRKAMKLLKANWKKLQSMSYAAIMLSLIHVALLEKTWLIYAIIVGVGFVIRMPPVKRRFVELRRVRRNRKLKENSI